ncbi:SWR1-complex protein 5 [Hirsutella minnesotensis 3608]|uniref:SWR1-complex protein 5 n=1 Tax=Hirsutella minnesotensis 3608 TaxID=1043627 RepID=A0A0F7ZNN0_9HYPO|nr:SWR1-complex protein 5 [Hirsutella minnesotensis 3608]
MPPDPEDDHGDEQYASSEDSDFAPGDAPEHASEDSGSDGEEPERVAKRRREDDAANGPDDGYDNSGDEAIINKGRKRQRKAQQRGDAPEDDDGGEGGLIKTRRQRAEEKEERKYIASRGPVTVDVDALWEQMVSGKPIRPIANDAETDQPAGPEQLPTSAAGPGTQVSTEAQATDDQSDTIRIKRTYNFAGRVHTEEKVVARDSAEAKLYLATQEKEATATEDAPTKRVTKKAFRSAFEPVIDAGPGRTDLNLGVAARIKAAREAQAKKLNTVEKSRMDWAGYVDKEGIKDELELASKSKGSYNARQDFLARSEAIREDDARRARMATRV